MEEMELFPRDWGEEAGTESEGSPRGRTFSLPPVVISYVPFLLFNFSRLTGGKEKPQ